MLDVFAPFTKQDFFREWVDALRSGQYEQVQGALRKEHDEFLSDTPQGPVGYCCLGVACEIAVSHGYAHRDGVQYSTLASDDATTTMLPWRLANWLELDADPEVKVLSDKGVRRVTLSILNDEWGYEFDQIADVIEKTWVTAKDREPVLV